MVGFVVVVFQSFMPGLNSMCCAVLCLVAHSCPTLCDPMDCSPSGPMDCSPPGSSVHGDSSGKNTRVECQALLQGNLPKPGIKPRSPALQADSLSAEPPSILKFATYLPPRKAPSKPPFSLSSNSKLDSAGLWL